MHFSIRRILLVTLIVALACTTYRQYYGQGIYFQLGKTSFIFDDFILLAANLAVVATATAGAVFASPRWRPPLVGYAAFGWAYFLFMLRAGFLIETARGTPQFIGLGMMLGLICALSVSALSAREK
jgi:hypothetical protein